MSSRVAAKKQNFPFTVVSLKTAKGNNLTCLE